MLRLARPLSLRLAGVVGAAVVVMAAAGAQEVLKVGRRRRGWLRVVQQRGQEAGKAPAFSQLLVFVLEAGRGQGCKGGGAKDLRGSTTWMGGRATWWDCKAAVEP